MLERHGNIAFPGAHVFPGGIVEPSDTDACGALLPSAQEWAAAGEGDRPPEAIVYWMAAARELFEEVGILLARRHGRPVERLPGAQVGDLRRRVLGGGPVRGRARGRDLGGWGGATAEIHAQSKHV